MKIFIVALDDDNADPDAVGVRVSEHYGEANYRVSQLTWVVAANAASPAEIGQKLGIEKPANEEKWSSGMVALIADYSGYADKSLWQLMRGWLA